jgi:mRNA interferase HigB
MRIVARNRLVAFWERHPETRASLSHWLTIAKAADWQDGAAVMSSFPKTKVLNGERVRFEVAGGDYRMIAAFDYRRRAVFIKFLGTHAEYDAVDALTVSMF